MTVETPRLLLPLPLALKRRIDVRQTMPRSTPLPMLLIVAIETHLSRIARATAGVERSFSGAKQRRDHWQNHAKQLLARNRQSGLSATEHHAVPRDDARSLGALLPFIGHRVGLSCDDFEVAIFVEDQYLREGDHL